MILRKAISILFIFIFTTLGSGQNRNNISGYITDAVSGENLSGANIFLFKDTLSLSPLRKTSSNVQGFYVLPKVESDIYFLLIRYIGYKPELKKIDLKKDIRLNIELSPIDRKEIVIKGKKEDLNSISSIDISPELISKLPSLSGEADLFKILQMLPGVKAANELSSGLYIRGGSPDQNLTLVDGMNIYNPSHIGNIASTFNSGAIQDIRLIKGAFPAEYGSRISGILDVKLRSGTKERETGVIGLGLINSYFTLEGPVSENSTYMISGRGMYYDKYQDFVKSKSIIPRYHFYDLNGKITYVISDANTFSVSGIYSSDQINSPGQQNEMNYDISWDNLNLGVNWFHINSSSLFITTLLNFTEYKLRSLVQSGFIGINPYTYFASSDLKDITVKENVELHWNENTIVKSGFEITGHDYNLLYADHYNNLIETDPYAGKKLFSIEAAAYLNTEKKITDLLNINAGLRFYYFNENKNFNAEPRISLSYYLNENTLLKAAYAQTHQFIHLLSKNDITFPTDLWFPSEKNVSPSRAIHYVFSVDQFFLEQQLMLSCETYYKKMDDLYDFLPGTVFNPLDENIQNQFIKGIGESYGVELFLHKRSGDLTGWIGYTLSWTKRRFDELNNGALFYPKYDRRHDISLVIAYAITNNLNAGVTWVYSTGQRYNLPMGQYAFNSFSPFRGSNIYYNYSSMNISELPPFHKMDVNVSYSFNLFKLPMQAYINIYNVYNRQNPFAQYVAFENKNDAVTAKLKRLVLFPFLPSIGFNIRF